MPSGDGRRSVLHVGCGVYAPEKLHRFFRDPSWRELRVDLEPGVRPDVVASIEDLSCFADGSVHAVWSSHNIEHLHGFQVPMALRAFRRVLKPDGFVLLTTPDIEQIAQKILDAGLDEIAYMSPAGPITPLDMLFGHQPSIQAGHALMAHKTAFSAQKLARSLADAGFAQSIVQKGPSFDLWAIGFIGEGHIDPDLLRKAAATT